MPFLASSPQDPGSGPTRYTHEFVQPPMTSGTTGHYRNDSAFSKFRDLSRPSGGKNFLDPRPSCCSPARPTIPGFSAFPDQPKSPSRAFGTDRSLMLTPSSLSDQRQNRQVRLSDISDRLTGVEKQVEKKTFAQLQAETTRIAVFKEAVQALERKVEAEIRDRIESHKSLTHDYEAQLHDLHNRIQEATERRFGELDSAFRDIDLRTSELLQRLKQIDEDQTLSILKSEVAQCHQEVTSVKAQLPQMIENRQLEFNERVRFIEESISRKFEEERISRTKKIDELTADAANLQHTLQDRSRTFQKTVSIQLDELRAMLEDERAQREQADDDIVVALNQYTVALHDALVKNGTGDREAKC